MHTAVLGHSFIRRLRDFIEGDLREEWTYVKFFGISGGRIRHMKDESRNWVNPDHCVLQIGCNDITAATNPLDLAMAILTLASRIRVRHSCRVTILGLFRRYSPCGMSRRVYKRKRLEVNDALRRMVWSFPDVSVHDARIHGR